MKSVGSSGRRLNISGSFHWPAGSGHYILHRMFEGDAARLRGERLAEGFGCEYLADADP